MRPMAADRARSIALFLMEHSAEQCADGSLDGSCSIHSSIEAILNGHRFWQSVHPPRISLADFEG